MSGRAALAAIVLAATIVAGWSGARLDVLAEGREAGEELLYLPNGRMLRVASLGQAQVVADAVYLWAIQYYSNYDREDRFVYVQHVFRDVIGELDPHYVDAYWMGALILSVEAHDLEGALSLLDKGFENNPDKWILPYLAGWEAYYAGRYDLAKTYFEKASEVPDAPSRVLRMVAGVEARTGDLESARELWRQVIDDPRSDATSRAIAERKVREYTVKLAQQATERAVEAFRQRNGRWPGSLEELVGKGYLDGLPLDDAGNVYPYDPATGSVHAPGAVLGDQ